MFAKALILAAVAGLASSAPLASSVDTTNTSTSIAGSSFGLIAIHSTSPVHLLALQASDYGFYLNKPTSSDCPVSIGDDCPAGNVTAFTYSNLTTIQMDVEVPGGQQLYVAPGVFGYTIPHSAALPVGAVVSGWEYTPPATINNVGTLNLPGYGFLACPTANSTVYQVITTNGTTNTDACIGIALATVDYTGEGAAAWEYA